MLLLLLHHCVQLVVLVVLLNEGLLLVPLMVLKLLLALLGGVRHVLTHANCCCTRLVVVAKVDFHGLLLLVRELGVAVGRHSQYVDLLIQIRILIEMIVETAIPTLAALIGLLSVVSRLVQVVVVDVAGAGVDDLTSGACHCVHHAWLLTHGSIIVSWAQVLVSGLPLVYV